MGHLKATGFVSLEMLSLKNNTYFKTPCPVPSADVQRTECAEQGDSLSHLEFPAPWGPVGTPALPCPPSPPHFMAGSLQGTSGYLWFFLLLSSLLPATGPLHSLLLLLGRTPCFSSSCFLVLK